MMITKHKLRYAVLLHFPWAGKRKCRQRLKDRALLDVLFMDPGYFWWTLCKASANENWRYLAEAMRLLLDAMGTVAPIVKCRAGHPVRYFRLMANSTGSRRWVEGHRVACGDKDCACRWDACTSPRWPVLHKLADALDRLQRKGDAQRYLEYFKPKFPCMKAGSGLI